MQRGEKKRSSKRHEIDMQEPQSLSTDLWCKGVKRSDMTAEKINEITFMGTKSCSIEKTLAICV